MAGISFIYPKIAWTHAQRNTEFLLFNWIYLKENFFFINIDSKKCRMQYAYRNLNRRPYISIFINRLSVFVCVAKSKLPRKQEINKKDTAPSAVREWKMWKLASSLILQQQFKLLLFCNLEICVSYKLIVKAKMFPWKIGSVRWNDPILNVGQT